MKPLYSVTARILAPGEYIAESVMYLSLSLLEDYVEENDQ